jgi:hypothetical protein
MYKDAPPGVEDIWVAQPAQRRFFDIPGSCLVFYATISALVAI